MTEDQSPQERGAATRRLYSVLKEYLDRLNWNWKPIEAALIMSGIHFPADCTETPSGAALDGEIFSGAGNERFSDARWIWQKWLWRCEDDQENGDVTPTELRPDVFLNWCEDTDIEMAGLWLTMRSSTITSVPIRSARFHRQSQTTRPRLRSPSIRC